MIRFTQELKFKLFIFIQYFAVGAMPYLPVFLFQKQYSGVQIGILLGTLPIVMIIIQPVWSFLSDLLGNRRIILVSSGIGAAVSGLCLGLANSFVFTFLWSILFMAFLSAIRPISMAIIFNALDTSGRMDKFSLIRLWGSIGFAISTMLIGWLFLAEILVYFGWIVFGTFFALTGLSLFLPEQKGIRTITERKWGLLISGNPQLVIYLMAHVFIGATLGVYNNYQAVFMQYLNAQNWLVGFTLSLQALVEVPMMIMVPYLLKRISPRVLILAGACLLPVRWFFYLLVQRPGWVAPSQIIHGVAVISFYVVGAVYIDRLVGTQWRATGQGLYGTAMDGIGSAIGVYLAGMVLEWYGVRSIWALSLILGLIGLGLLLLAFKQHAPVQDGVIGAVQDV